MHYLIGLLEIINTLGEFSKWRDGCPDCGKEERVREWTNYGKKYLRCFQCNCYWVKGER